MGHKGMEPKREFFLTNHPAETLHDRIPLPWDLERAHMLAKETGISVEEPNKSRQETKISIHDTYTYTTKEPYT